MAVVIAVVFGLTAALAVTGRSAHADWRRIQDVTRGTAQVLEKGELTFGVFAPIAYGVTESLTVQSSPIFDLLLMPNLTARYRFVRSRSWVLSGVVNYKQAFYSPEGQASSNPGEFDLGASSSIYLGSSVALTGGLFISNRFGREGRDPDQAGIALQLAAHALLGKGDLLALSAYQRFTGDGLQRPTVTAAWVKQLRVVFNVHLVVGVSYGRFPLRGGPVDELSVWPVVDAWWRY